METNEAVVVDTQSNEAEGTEQETIAISKKDYESLNQTLGSLKRELKDLKKPKETQETAKTNQPDENVLLKKAFLRSAGIVEADEVEEALKTAKKWGVEVDQLVDDEDFKLKLDKLRTNKANTLATSNIKGSAGVSQAKNSAEYWIAQGKAPSRTDVPDRKTRVGIVKAMMANSKSSKTFYND